MCKGIKRHFLLTLAACPLLWPVLSDGISVLCTLSPQAQALLQRTSARRIHKGGGGREGCLQRVPEDTGPGQMGMRGGSGSLWKLKRNLTPAPERALETDCLGSLSAMEGLPIKAQCASKADRYNPPPFSACRYPMATF
ncbi:uncharacterized [Tachysurus ichikawai]